MLETKKLGDGKKSSNKRSGVSPGSLSLPTNASQLKPGTYMIYVRDGFDLSHTLALTRTLIRK